MMTVPILYEDENVLLADKPAGMLSEASDTQPSVITALSSHGEEGFLAPVTRLDKGVSGVILLAKNKKSAAFLSALVQDKTKMQKEYLAIISGRMEEKKGTLRDLLFKESAKNKTDVVQRVRRGVKEAILHYEVLQEATVAGKALSLVSVRLETGRTHQIRVQFASRKHALVGDGRYGGDTDFPLGLLAYRLSFCLPNGKRVFAESGRVGDLPFSFFSLSNAVKEDEKTAL